MSKSLNKYLTENCFRSIYNPVLESIRNSDIDKALDLISSFLRKRKVYTLPAIELCQFDGVPAFAVFAWTGNNKGCAFTWLRGETATLSGISFTNDFDKIYTAFNNHEVINWDVAMSTKGASIVRVLQLVADVMNGRINADVASLNKAVRDAQIWEAFEGDTEGLENILCEGVKDDPTLNALKKRKDALYMKIRAWNRKGQDTTELQAQYDQLKAEFEDARISVRKDIPMQAIVNPDEKKVEDRFEEEYRATPQERFSDMESYVRNVIDGIDTCALICGAPGVGKTFRIMQAIKKAGKQLGMDYEVIKGKCTPLTLYTMLHDFQEQGQIIVIDDADDIIQDITSINILKAATDSSEERIVSYGSSAAPLVPEEKQMEFDDWEMDGNGKLRYPKRFEYKGGIIIITNMQAGGIDTAIRSRAMICDLSFSTQEVLDLVKSLSPHIAPETLTPQAKDKAFAYLQKLADDGAPMEISIRTFTLVAKLYLSDAPTDAIERRIREQMRLKFSREKGRY